MIFATAEFKYIDNEQWLPLVEEESKESGEKQAKRHKIQRCEVTLFRDLMPSVKTDGLALTATCQVFLLDKHTIPPLPDF